MSETTDAVRITIEAMKGHRVDNRLVVACNVVGALREAGLIPYPTTQPTDSGSPEPTSQSQSGIADGAQDHTNGIEA